MNLQPLRDFIALHELQTAPEYSALDVCAQSGKLAEAMLRAKNYGRGEVFDDETTARMQARIGDLMFAVAYLSTLYGIDLEAALWESVQKFEEKLKS